jgi:hypothetical protein
MADYEYDNRDSTYTDGPVSEYEPQEEQSYAPAPAAQAAAPETNPGLIRKKLMGYVGFSNLPNQVHRKSVRRGFQFTAMVVGASQRAKGYAQAG